MNRELFFYSIAEIGISICVGVLILFFSYKIIDNFFKKKYNIEISNISFAVLLLQFYFQLHI